MTASGSDAIETAAAGKLDPLVRLLTEAPEIARLRGASEKTLLHIAIRQWPELANGAEVVHGARLDSRDDSYHSTARELAEYHVKTDIA